MMSRWAWFLGCAILGLVMLVCGWLVPMHLRAVDASVLQKAGRNTPALVEQGLALAREKKLGAAQLLSQAAQQKGIPGREKLGLAVANLTAQQPGSLNWGDDESRLESLFGNSMQSTNSGFEPFTEFMVRQENRDKAL